MKIDLNLLPIDEETELGASHFLGCPDVPSSWNEEALFYNDEIFLGQINLSDVNCDLLPNKGILYFFFASLSKPFRAIVRYAEDISDIERIDFNCEVDFDSDLNFEYELSISNGCGNIELLPENVKLKHYPLKKDDVILLKLDNLDNTKLSFLKNNNDPVCIIINKNDLINKDFTKCMFSFLLDE